MTDLCDLPQELVDKIISFCLDIIQPHERTEGNEKKERSRQILKLRLVCPGLNNAIEDWLPRLDEFYVWKTSYPMLARLKLFHAVMKGQEHSFPLVSAVRQASELILDIHGAGLDGERDYERRNIRETVCLSVTHGVVAGRPADNRRNNVIWDQQDWEEATLTIAVGTAAYDGDVTLLHTLMDQGLYTGFAVDHVFKDPLLVAEDMRHDGAVRALYSLPLMSGPEQSEALLSTSLIPSTPFHNTPDQDNAQLHFAAELGDLGLFVGILNDITSTRPGRGLFVRNADGETPGVIAAKLGKEAIVAEVCRQFNRDPEGLLDSGRVEYLQTRTWNADESVVDTYNFLLVEPPIAVMQNIAAERGHAAVLDTIRRSKCSTVNLQLYHSDRWHHPVFAAAANGHFTAARMLMSSVRLWVGEYQKAAWLGLLGSARSGHVGIFDYFLCFD
ncbi:hypothetical protein BDW74DRAFT_178213 [Aspergillus multicolor]|uniref:uncharacterized protein n=1 Tax=Aspergillus multicolor TaxID=41759 RepID=UPI003CCE46C0